MYTPNQLALMNLPLIIPYGMSIGLSMLVVISNDTDLKAIIKNTGMNLMGIGSVSAFAFPIIASGMTVATQNPTWLLLDFIPLATIGTGFLLIDASNSIQ